MEPQHRVTDTKNESDNVLHDDISTMCVSVMMSYRRNQRRSYSQYGPPIFKNGGVKTKKEHFWTLHEAITRKIMQNIAEL